MKLSNSFILSIMGLAGEGALAWNGKATKTRKQENKKINELT
jgi:hypothetical protein